MTTPQPVPCYWCKSAVVGLANWESIENVYCVECHDCGARGPFASTRDEAVQLWNELGERMAGLSNDLSRLRAEHNLASGLVTAGMKAMETNEALTAEVARLREALKPFADLPVTVGTALYWRDGPSFGGRMDAVHCVRARAALSVSEGASATSATPIAQNDLKVQREPCPDCGSTAAHHAWHCNAPQAALPAQESGGADDIRTTDGIAAGSSDTSGGGAG